MSPAESPTELPGDPGSPPGSRLRTWIGAALVLAVFALFRLDAVGRVKALFLADSAEYLMLAQGLITDNRVPVESLRCTFFSLLLWIPLALRELVVGATAGYSSEVARLVPLGFHLLACLGAYRLGRIASGAGAGFLAAIVVAVLPEFGYWSVDYLTDGPAGAAIVWTCVFWLEGRPVGAGFVLGLAVLLRYQSLITLLAFLPVPLVARRWKDLGRVALGGLVSIALLALLDWTYWGRPFVSMINFAKKQLGTFVPVEVVPTLSVESGNITRTGAWHYYLDHAFEIFTWPLTVAFLLWIVARWTAKRRGALDLGVWITIATIAGLSPQRYKEARYLLAIMPVAAAVGSASLVEVARLLTSRIPALRAKGAAWLRAAALVAAGAAFATLCWEEQQERPYDVFGAHIDAARSIPPADRPIGIATYHPWLLVADNPVLGTDRGTWTTARFTIHGTPRFLSTYGERAQALRQYLEPFDYVVTPGLWGNPGNGWWRYVNERFTIAGAFRDTQVPVQTVYLLGRRAQQGETRPKAFWNAVPDWTGAAEPLVRYDTGLELLGAEATLIAETANVIRIDTTWRQDGAFEESIMALVSFSSPAVARATNDRFWVLPPSEEAREFMGLPARVTRISRYVSTPFQLPGAELHMHLLLLVADEEGKPIGREARPERVNVSRLPDGRPDFTLRVARPPSNDP